MPEERTPQPHERRALFNGEREIIAHSHREVGQFNPETSGNLVAQPACAPKVAPERFRSPIDGRDRHQPLQHQRRLASEQSGELLDTIRAHTPLPDRPAEIDLNQDRRASSHRFGRRLERQRQARRVDGVHPVEELERSAHLVPLQAPDEVPRGSPGDGGVLALRFLYVVFPDVEDAGVERRDDGVRRQRFGDAHDAYRRRIAARAARRRVDLRTDGGDARRRLFDRGEHAAHGPGDRRTSQVAGV